MSRYILAGYRIQIEEVLKEITTLGDDQSISIRPQNVIMDRICRDQDEIQKAIDDYFELEREERK